MEYKLKLLNTSSGMPFTVGQGPRRTIHDKTVVILGPGKDRAGNYATGLTEQEEREFEILLGNKPKGYLSKVSKFWSGGEDFGETFKPFLYRYVANIDTKSGNDKGSIIDVEHSSGLNDVYKQLTIKMLLANPQLVRTKGGKWHPTQVVEMVSLEDELKQKISTFSTKAKAYALYEKFTEAELLDLFYMISPQKDRSVKKDIVLSKLADLVENRPDTFISVAGDPNLTSKLLISKWIEDGVINKRRDEFFFEDTLLGTSVSTINEFLSSGKNSKFKLAIQAASENGYKELASAN